MTKIKDEFVKLTNKQLEQKYNFIQNYKQANNAAEGSNVDANSNVATKNIATLMAELNKDINIQIKRYCVSKKIEELFGKELADEYNRQIETHEIYVHDESQLYPYCTSITMYPFLLNGLKGLGGESISPKHLVSFCGSFINLCFAISSQFAGALATVEFLMYFDYFARKDFGDNYLETNKKEIENALQQVLYSLNQPAAARGYQSIFWNISIFDKYYLESLFGELVFPDFSKPDFESIKKLQRFFMNWFNEERRKALLTFPVVTAAMVVDENGPKDEEFLDMCAEQDSKGNSFFKYESDSVDSLASCCFSKEQKVLARFKDKIYYEKFGNLGITKDGPNKENFSIFHNGSWCLGKLVKLPKRQMYKIKTSNKKEIVVSDNHLHPTLNGIKSTYNLTTNDYLLFNTNILNAVPEQDFHLTYEQGYAVGAFLGDGSFGSRMILSNGIKQIYETDYSLNKVKLNRSIEKIQKAIEQLGSNSKVHTYIGEEELVPTRISSKELVKFIQYWTNWKEGTTSVNKELNLSCLIQSEEFRRGIVDGLYDTDGGNSNRIYTTSPILKEHIELLFTSLGINTIIDISDRTGEIAFEENGKKYLRNYPTYCIRWYTPKNKRSMKDVYKVFNNGIYFKINSIEKVEYDDDLIYCFEMENKEESYFTLPNGLITHNCRLRNELQDNTFSYSLGAGGTQSGSLNVITINMNRLVQNADKALIDVEDYLKEQVQKIHKYQIATKEFFKGFLESKMLDAYKEGFIDMNKQFLTIGINGLLESAEYKGCKIGNNEEYKEYTSSLLRVIFEENKKARKEYGINFNTEFVPAENLGVKNYKWDKKDGYVIPKTRECYNSYLYVVEDNEIDPIDKFFLHGRENLQYLDGGSALHLNLEEYPTKESYKKLYKVAAKTGCNYWTTNIEITCCEEEDCGYIDKRTLDHCSKCGSKNISHATRVIGYLRKKKNYSLERQKEANQRYRSKIQ